MISRRQTLKGLGALLTLSASGLWVPAQARLPRGFATGAVGAAFDYYASPTGSDSNAGTLASPWAITSINTKQSTYSGKRLGLLPGTYDVSVLMQNAGYQGAVLQIQGGSSNSVRTYIGTSSSGGTYQAGTATLDAKGSVGSYGGGNTAHAPYVLGQTIGSTGTGPQPTAWGNWTIDGLNCSGFSNWAFTIGGGIDTLPTTPANITITNCSLFNSVSTLTGTHPGPIMCYQYNGNILINNCWLYNCINTAVSGSDPTHFAGITGEGFGGGSSGLTIQFCSLVQSSGIYIFQDNGAALNTTIQFNYIDIGSFYSSNSVPITAFAGCTGPTTGQPGNVFRNNIVVGGSFADNIGYQATYNGSPFLCYNNTWVRVSSSGNGTDVGFRCIETTGVSGQVTAYNNLMYDNGVASIATYGYMSMNTDGLALCDFNIYGALNKFSTYGASGGTSPTGGLSFASWKTAIGGKDANSSTNATNPFTNNGAYALQYQTPSGPAFGTGRVGGLSSGGVCNVGAWSDSSVTQIGCNLPLP